MIFKLNKTIKQILEERRLTTTAQKYIDLEVIRKMDPYTPKRIGTLKSTPINQTWIGSGSIRQKTPYARRLYYGDDFVFNESPRRGSRWFERMKANHKNEILNGVAKLTGGKVVE